MSLWLGAPVFGVQSSGKIKISILIVRHFRGMRVRNSKLAGIPHESRHTSVFG